MKKGRKTNTFKVADKILKNADEVFIGGIKSYAEHIVTIKKRK